MKPLKNTEVLERTLLLRIEELEGIATALIQENKGLKNKLNMAEAELKSLKESSETKEGTDQ